MLELAEYEYANHGFNLPGVPWYDEEYDQLAWQKNH